MVVMVITHGLTLRLVRSYLPPSLPPSPQLIMRWFQYSISDFEESLNPPNGGLVVVNRKTDSKVRPPSLPSSLLPSLDPPNGGLVVVDRKTDNKVCPPSFPPSLPPTLPSSLRAIQMK